MVFLLSWTSSLTFVILMFKSDSLNDSKDIRRELITSPLQLSVLLSDSSLSVNLESDIVVVAVRFRPINTTKNCKYTFFKSNVKVLQSSLYYNVTQVRQQASQAGLRALFFNQDSARAILRFKLGTCFSGRLHYCPDTHTYQYMSLNRDASWTSSSFSPAYTEFLSTPWSSSPTIWTFLSVFCVKYSFSSWARRVLPLHG